MLDLMLPGMSGYAVCEEVRRQRCGHSDLDSLAAHAHGGPRPRLQRGADVYLQKPFDLEELLSIVRSLLSRRKRKSGAEEPKNANVFDGRIYRFGRWVNFDTFEVSVAGEKLRLSALEMKLLKYFVDHEGSVVRRGELLAQVWGVPQSITTRTVDNFIVNLRKYFEIDPSHPRHFLSIRGAGYRFVADSEEAKR